MNLTRLALGMAALGRPGYMSIGHGGDFPLGRSRAAMEAQAHAVLDAAFAKGVRLVDCARSYGDSEKFVRSWLDTRGLTKAQVSVASKWGYTYTADWLVDTAVHERKDHSLENLVKQLRESRAILGDRLELYQIHSATLETGVLVRQDVLDALGRLRAEGVAIGLTATGPDQATTIRRALEVERDGAPLFTVIQATWNLLERSCEDACREAHAAGRAVLVKESLANGRLSPRGPEGTSGPLAEVARARGVTPDAIALAAVLERPWVTTALVGATTVVQLESNVRALEIRLTPDELRQLESVRISSETYWRERAKLSWN